MIAGTKVRVVGLVARPELNGLEGVALRRLVSKNKEKEAPRYCVELSSEKLSLKQANLMPVNHEESVHGDMLHVNGLCYCAAHRLEICGACTYDFRVQNRIMELGDHPSPYEEAERIDAAEMRLNKPPRRAPCKDEPKAPPVSMRLGKQAALPKKSETLDPATLEEWRHAVEGPLGKAFKAGFSMRELVEGSKDVHYELRKSLYLMGEGLDKVHGDATLPGIRFIVQDKAQSVALTLDVIDVRRKEDVPLLIVRWFYGTVGNLAQVQKIVQNSMKTFKKGSVFHNLETTLDEVHLFKRLLVHNEKKLDPEYVSSKLAGLDDFYRLSILQPILKDPFQADPTDPCANCGKAAKKTCVRCKKEKYCSAECQKIAWKKGHKVSCKTPGEIGDAEIVEVELHVEGLNNGAPAGLHQLNLSMDAAMGTWKNPKDAVNKAMEPKVGRSADKLFVVKLQVPLCRSSSFHGQDILCYDKTRKLQLSIGPKNCSNSQRIEAAVRSSPLEFKAYINAYISKDNKKLHLIVSDILPVQSW